MFAPGTQISAMAKKIVKRVKYCPECDAMLEASATRCHECGWIKPENKKGGMKQCKFEDNGTRCPLPAVIDDQTCRYHVNFWDDPKTAALNLQEILGGKVNHNRNWREEAIQDFQQRHPEFAVVPQDREEIKAYIDMTRKFLRRGHPLPYDKTKKISDED